MTPADKELAKEAVTRLRKILTLMAHQMEAEDAFHAEVNLGHGRNTVNLVLSPSLANMMASMFELNAVKPLPAPSSLARRAGGAAAEEALFSNIVRNEAGQLVEDDWVPEEDW